MKTLQISENKSLTYKLQGDEVKFTNLDKTVKLSLTQVWELFRVFLLIDDQADIRWEKSTTVDKEHFSEYIGFDFYVSVMLFKGKRYYDIRRWWKPKSQDDAVPTKEGIRFNAAEANTLRGLKDELFEDIPDLDLINLCPCLGPAQFFEIQSCDRCMPSWVVIPTD